MCFAGLEESICQLVSPFREGPGSKNTQLLGCRVKDSEVCKYRSKVVYLYP